ncbi:MAG: hypothetical protein LBT62_07045 [Deltaproteobacteria bacterium]|nr:hypothetical protein [Deltaproteobacteria bacterium]
MDNNHSYLFRPGLWKIDGIYLDKNEVRHRQTGQLVIIHSPDLWTIDNQVNISGQDARDFVTRYEITPFEKDKSYTEWKSLTGGPEPIFGLFVVVEDCIMMPWQSRTGTYWGQEVMARVGGGEYLSRGFAFIKQQKVSSWAVRLTLEGAPARDDVGEKAGENVGEKAEENAGKGDDGEGQG